MSDHYHYDYASTSHDHRGQYADDRHDHGLDYAEKYHRHYDDESAVRGLREDLGAAEERIRALEEDLRGALAQLCVLDRLRPTCVICRDATADRQTVRGPACPDCAGDLPDDGPDAGFPGPWAFAEGDMSEYGNLLPEAEPHGPATMRQFMREHPLSPGDYVQQSAGCAETSDGEHTSAWHEGGQCRACGLLGPSPDEEPKPEPEEYDPGPEIDDEGGMSEYRYLLPEDYERGQS
jgi:hypothetical protein